MNPTPLKTILSQDRYPFAVAYVKDNQIKATVAYAPSLSEVYFQLQGWRSYRPQDNYIMVEMKNSEWIAV